MAAPGDGVASPFGFAPAYGSEVRPLRGRFRRGAEAPLYLRSKGKSNGKNRSKGKSNGKNRSLGKSGSSFARVPHISEARCGAPDL
jgi:hypothetical protein